MYEFLWLQFFVVLSFGTVVILQLPLMNIMITSTLKKPTLNNILNNLQDFNSSTLKSLFSLLDEIRLSTEGISFFLDALMQAMDRAHRLGQRKVVNVHRLIMRGTLEEKVMSLQKFKVSVANAVINAENASMKTMNTDQLLDLFTSAETSKKVPPVCIHSGHLFCSFDVFALGLTSNL